MRPIEQWIWLPEDEYPQYQTTAYHPLMDNASDYEHFAVAEFQKRYCFGKSIQRVELRFSGDTSCYLTCNYIFVARGPASAGGDFLWPWNSSPMPQHYAWELTLDAVDYPEFDKGVLDFQAMVRMTSGRIFEYSRGHGGFFLTAYVYFADGSRQLVLTDETWQVRHLTAYTEQAVYDNSLPQTGWVNAQRIANIWHCETAPTQPCEEKNIFFDPVTVPAGQRISQIFSLDMIYAGYPSVQVQTAGALDVTLFCREWQDEGSKIRCHFEYDGAYECMELCSAGEILLEAVNPSDQDAKIQLVFSTSHYPVKTQAKTVTSDPELNLVLDVCAHTLKYCRQTLHLDSPRHCEPLACTGDYYIESLMTAFTFGDQSLSAFDIRRTAELLCHRDGRMFHTTYSLIWVQMLWDVYMLTGEKKLLSDCRDALDLLLRRFETYLGENGLIETPPDYMFIDWLFPDGISTHHPPKALGQSCLNLFYFGALRTASKIYDALGDGVTTKDCENRSELLKVAILENLYDKEQKLFFEGLNTPTPEHLLNQYMPINVEKRYYRKHANILAAYFGILDRGACQDLLRRIMGDDSLGQVQPYFSHFLLEAVYRNGLRDEFTLEILQQWKAPVLECSKGLAEGFYKPEPTYSFDHSHAWGGTPAWSLPLALSGMEILEPGMKKIKLDPSLLGLEKADVQIPTPYGMVELELKQGVEPVIYTPEAVEVII